MFGETLNRRPGVDRRTFLKQGLALPALAAVYQTGSRATEPRAASRPSSRSPAWPLPMARFRWQGRLAGIQSAGYRHVAWGTQHVRKGASACR